MKTKILTIAMSTLLTTNTFANFKVIISSEANNYNYGEKVVIVGEWLATEEKSCSKDNLAEDYYYGIEFDQTETCSAPQERITTTKVVYSDGREEKKNNTDIGYKIKSIIDKGLLVSDNIINDLIIKVLSD